MDLKPNRLSRVKSLCTETEYGGDKDVGQKSWLCHIDKLSGGGTVSLVYVCTAPSTMGLGSLGTTDIYIK